MKPLVYKFDIEASLTMQKLRDIYKSSDLAQDFSKKKKWRREARPRVGDQLTSEFRRWVQEEKEGSSVNSYAKVYNDFFKRLATAKEAHTPKIKNWAKNRKLAPYRVFMNLFDDDILKSDKPNPTLESIERFLAKFNVTILDYDAGQAEQQVGSRIKQVRIGRFLNSLKKDPTHSYLAQKLLKEYTNDPSRGKHVAGTLKLMFSRHPMDIVGATTTTSWNSCLNLTEGCNKAYTPVSFNNGLLVVYVVRVMPPKNGEADGELKFVGRKTIYPAHRIDRYNGEVLYSMLYRSNHAPVIYVSENGKHADDDDDYDDGSLAGIIPHVLLRDNLSTEEELLIKWFLTYEGSLPFPLYSRSKNGITPSEKYTALVLSDESKYGAWNHKLDDIVNLYLYEHYNSLAHNKDSDLVFIPLDLYRNGSHFLLFNQAKKNFVEVKVEARYNPDYDEPEDDDNYDEEEPLDEEDDYDEDE